MATSNQMTNALLTEHFRYTPLTLLDDIINTVNELVFRAINAIEEGLNNTSPESLGFKLENSKLLPDEARRDALHEAKQAEIDNGIVALETLLNATVDKDFDKFEIYTLRNILAVGHEEENLSSWVQLEHYKNVGIPQSQDAPTPEQVQLQRRKLQETTKLNAMLKAEEAKNAATLSQMQSLIGNESSTEDSTASTFAFLSSSAHAANNQSRQPVHQNVRYALSQLPALRQLLSQLKTAQQAVPNARRERPDPDSTQARREQYVESQSRRALDRKGIHPENAATVDASIGRKIGRDEVEGMEAVVQALGGADTVSRSGDDMED